MLRKVSDQGGRKQDIIKKYKPIVRKVEFAFECSLVAQPRCERKNFEISRSLVAVQVDRCVPEYITIQGLWNPQCAVEVA